MARSVCTAAMFLAVLTDVLQADDPPLPKLNVVFFTPSDVEPPSDVVQRLTEVADYTEAFFVKWMKHWGYPPAREKFFDREPDGDLRVLFVRGRQPRASGRYDKAGFEAEAWNQATPKYQLGRHRHVWWTWVYLGDAPLRFRGFEGRGNSRNGGNALTNYLNAKGEIHVADDIGARFLDEFSLKGAMHELGHAFGLPHNGPLAGQELGMPLMGANVANYRRRTNSRETRGYLSQASAAMLWKHPVFSGTAIDRNLLPRVTFSDLQVVNGAGRSLHLRGRLESNYPAHSLVAFDSVPGVHATYWQKPYVARIADGGRFDVEITEPARKPGTLKLLVCFDNGAVTGDGKDYGIRSTYDVNYHVNRHSYELSGR